MRLHLTLALITALALILTFRTGSKPRFSFANVQEMAQKLALAKYVAPKDVMVPQLKTLKPDQERGIFWKQDFRLWRKKGLPFQVDFYPQLNSNPLPHLAVPINTVDRKGAHPLAYSPAFFNFLNLNFDPPLPADLGYAGFYVRYPYMAPKTDPNSPLDGFFSVLGGNYFRALAKEQVYGLSARGLALNTVVENKEEFPNFVQWWLREPTQNANSMVLDALLDSPSVSGAYEFTLHPGAQTSVDVHATLFFRQAAPQLGIAPFSSMYFYGENAKNHFGNFHPEIHDSDGVLIATGAGDWLWRPLEQQTQRQVYNFEDENPKGFGLVQRDRDFQHYQDLDMNYNVRPSAWVTPHHGWGKGAVTVIQLVTNNTNTDNVALFWHPANAPKAGDRLDLDYTIDFYMNDANRPPLAYVKQTLVNDPAPPPVAPPAPVTTAASANGKPPMAAPPGKAPAIPPPAAPVPPPKPIPTGTIPVQFLVDYMGDGIENVAANHPPDLDLVCTPKETVIREYKVEKNSYDNSWRVTFTIIPAKPHVPTEILCRLLRDGKPISEKWSYTWHQ